MKMIQAAVVAALLTTGAAQAGDNVHTRYVLDANGNLATQQYTTKSNSDKAWKTVGIVALSIIGIAGGVWLINEWTEDDDPQPVQQPSNGLVPQGGSSSTEWTTDYLIPTYTTVQ